MRAKDRRWEQELEIMVERNLKEFNAFGSEKLDYFISAFWKKTGTKNGKTGASERKQSAHIQSRPISLSQQYSEFKKILKKIIIKDMNVKGKCDKTQQEWF